MCPCRFTNLIFFFIYKTNLVLFEAALCQCALPDTESVLQFSGNMMGSNSSQESPIYLPLHASPRAAVSVQCLQPHPLDQTCWARLRRRERTDPLSRDVSVLWRALRDRTWCVRKALGAAASLQLTRSVTTLSLIKSLSDLNWER